MYTLSRRYGFSSKSLLSAGFCAIFPWKALLSTVVGLSASVVLSAFYQFFSLDALIVYVDQGIPAWWSAAKQIDLLPPIALIAVGSGGCILEVVAFS